MDAVLKQREDAREFLLGDIVSELAKPKRTSKPRLFRPPRDSRYVVEF
jgi:hypothetical protein